MTCNDARTISDLGSSGTSQEAEELRVFEVLYKRLEETKRLTPLDARALKEEVHVDEALERFFLHRIERQLRDLTVEQTEGLVREQLKEDPAGATMVVDLLRRVIRASDESTTVSLAGKPVIVTYLLEVLGELRADETRVDQTLTEWQIFTLIIEKLMLRDFRRAPELLPSVRRSFLGKLALSFAATREGHLGEHDFREFVKENISEEVARREREGRPDALEGLYEDLRSSSTLTRSAISGRYVWRFSHNSLREYLVAAEILQRFLSGRPYATRVTLTETMQLFVASMPEPELQDARVRLAEVWPVRRSSPGIDQIANLILPGLVRAHSADMRRALASLTGDGLDLRDVRFRGLRLSGTQEAPVDLMGLQAEGAEFTEVDFSHVNLSRASLAGVVMDACQLRGAVAESADFSGSFLLDCDITSFDPEGADFRNMDEDSTALFESEEGVVSLSGDSLRGYLAALGARTDPVGTYYRYAYRPEFDICRKVVKNLAAGAWSQRRGLEQRGKSQRDPGFARGFVDSMVKAGLLSERSGKASVVKPTAEGRAAFTDLLERQELHPAILQYLDGHRI